MVSCQLLVGAKHLEDKLSLIAKNSSPNASPVQLLVVSCQFSPAPCPLLSACIDDLMTLPLALRTLRSRSALK